MALRQSRGEIPLLLALLLHCMTIIQYQSYHTDTSPTPVTTVRNLNITAQIQCSCVYCCIFIHESVFSVHINEDIMLVQVKQGALEGFETKSPLTEKSFCAFLGIPYAKPPVGDLRFKPPLPIDRWDGVLSAKEPGSDCIQLDLRQEMVGSEDCLYLNVYTPEAPSKIKVKKPVMVFIHGGGFMNGTASPALYSPDFLLDHDVVFVSLNYRLHILGFLNLNTPSCPGNAGMKDQLLALKWIKENIENFGGDAENITLFGESAGGSAVHFLMLSPAAKGLFKRTIIQSGSALAPWAITSDPEANAFKAGDLLGYKGNEAEELIELFKKQSAEKLCDIVMNIHLQRKELYKGKCSSLLFVPSVEAILQDAFLPDIPQNLIKTAPSLPMITGIDDKEGLLIFLSHSEQLVKYMIQDFSIVIKNNFDMDQTQVHELATKAKKFYFGNQDLTPENLEPLTDLYTDLYFMKIKEAFDDQIASSTCPTYLYEFSYNGKRNLLKNMIRMQLNDTDSMLKVPGAAHADELGYLFRHQALEGSTVPVPIEGVDKQVIDNMSSLWTNFAKTGNPTSSLPNVEWKPCTSSQSWYLKINDDLKLTKGMILEDRLKFWKDWTSFFQKS